jgi:pimeloyl-ACP methyl ester carboxylesterase
MSGRTSFRRYAGVAGGTVLFAAGAAATVIAERQRVSRRRGASAPQPFGALRGDRHTVVADDGVELYAEVDEPSDAATGPATIVFVHGYALNLDCWHYERAALRGQHRLVFYDQRSHGRSSRSPAQNCTFDQLGRDLAEVVDQLAGDGPVIVVGHSMGGMTIMSLAEQHPEWFGERIAGVGLVSTSAAGVNAETLGMPGAAGRLLHRVTPAVVATLARAPRLVERGRRASSEVSLALTRRLAFGRSVSDEVVDFTDQMLAATPFDVVADFFPGFDDHDKRDALPVLQDLPTVVICGTLDAITSMETCHAIIEIVPTARLVEVVGAGHMVILERPREVTAAIEQLVGWVQEGS